MKNKFIIILTIFLVVNCLALPVPDYLLNNDEENKWIKLKDNYFMGSLKIEPDSKKLHVGINTFTIYNNETFFEDILNSKNPPSVLIKKYKNLKDRILEKSDKTIYDLSKDNIIDIKSIYKNKIFKNKKRQIEISKLNKIKNLKKEHKDMLIDNCVSRDLKKIKTKIPLSLKRGTIIDKHINIKKLRKKGKLKIRFLLGNSDINKDNELKIGLGTEVYTTSLNYYNGTSYGSLYMNSSLTQTELKYNNYQNSRQNIALNNSNTWYNDTTDTGYISYTPYTYSSQKYNYNLTTFFDVQNITSNGDTNYSIEITHSGSIENYLNFTIDESTLCTSCDYDTIKCYDYDADKYIDCNRRKFWDNFTESKLGNTDYYNDGYFTGEGDKCNHTVEDGVLKVQLDDPDSTTTFCYLNTTWEWPQSGLTKIQFKIYIDNNRYGRMYIFDQSEKRKQYEFYIHHNTNELIYVRKNDDSWSQEHNSNDLTHSTWYDVNITKSGTNLRTEVYDGSTQKIDVTSNNIFDCQDCFIYFRTFDGAGGSSGNQIRIDDLFIQANTTDEFMANITDNSGLYNFTFDLDDEGEGNHTDDRADYTTDSQTNTTYSISSTLNTTESTPYFDLDIYDSNDILVYNQIGQSTGYITINNLNNNPETLKFNFNDTCEFNFTEFDITTNVSNWYDFYLLDGNLENYTLDYLKLGIESNTTDLTTFLNDDTNKTFYTKHHTEHINDTLELPCKSEITNLNLNVTGLERNNTDFMFYDLADSGVDFDYNTNGDTFWYRIGNNKIYGAINKLYLKFDWRQRGTNCFCDQWSGGDYIAIKVYYSDSKSPSSESDLNYVAFTSLSSSDLNDANCTATTEKRVFEFNYEDSKLFHEKYLWIGFEEPDSLSCPLEITFDTYTNLDSYTKVYYDAAGFTTWVNQDMVASDVFHSHYPYNLTLDFIDDSNAEINETYEELNTSINYEFDTTYLGYLNTDLLSCDVGNYTLNVSNYDYSDSAFNLETLELNYTKLNITDWQLRYSNGTTILSNSSIYSDINFTLPTSLIYNNDTYNITSDFNEPYNLKLYSNITGNFNETIYVKTISEENHTYFNLTFTNQLINETFIGDIDNEIYNLEIWSNSSTPKNISDYTHNNSTGIIDINNCLDTNINTMFYEKDVSYCLSDSDCLNETYACIDRKCVYQGIPDINIYQILPRYAPAETDIDFYVAIDNNLTTSFYSCIVRDTANLMIKNETDDLIFTLNQIHTSELGNYTINCTACNPAGCDYDNDTFEITDYEIVINSPEPRNDPDRPYAFDINNVYLTVVTNYTNATCTTFINGEFGEEKVIQANTSVPFYVEFFNGENDFTVECIDSGGRQIRRNFQYYTENLYDVGIFGISYQWDSFVIDDLITPYKDFYGNVMLYILPLMLIIYFTVALICITYGIFYLAGGN